MDAIASSRVTRRRGPYRAMFKVPAALVISTPPSDPLGQTITGCEAVRLCKTGTVVIPCVKPARLQAVVSQYMAELTRGAEIKPEVSSVVDWRSVCSCRFELVLPTAYNSAWYATLSSMVRVALRILARAAGWIHLRYLAGAVVIGDCSDADVDIGGGTRWAGFLNMGVFAVAVSVSGPAFSPSRIVVVPPGAVFVRRDGVSVDHVRGASIRLCFGASDVPACPAEMTETSFVVINGAIPRFWNGLYPCAQDSIGEVADGLVCSMGLYMNIGWHRDHRVADKLRALYSDECLYPPLVEEAVVSN